MGLFPILSINQNMKTHICRLLLTLAAWIGHGTLSAAQTPPSFIFQDFESGPFLKPAGDAKVEWEKSCAKVGAGCVKITFGGGAEAKKWGTAQASPSPELKDKLRGVNATGVRLWVRGEGKPAEARFRFQWRSPENVKDIRGASEAILPIGGAEWTQVTLPFNEFTAPPEQGAMDVSAFDKLIAQVQINSRAGEKTVLWIDQIEFANVPPGSGKPPAPDKPAEKPKKDKAATATKSMNKAAGAATAVVGGNPVLPGRDWKERIDQESAKLEAESLGNVGENPEAEFRPAGCLNGQWHLLWVTGDNEEASHWQRHLVPSFAQPQGGALASWYVRRFAIPETFRGRRIQVEFGAVSLYAEVFLNGQAVGKHAGAYTPFSCDVTAAARIGETNTLTVYVRDDSYARDKGALIYQVGYSGGMAKSPKPSDSGIWQDVVLRGLPAVAIRDIYVIPSWRKHTLETRVELDGAASTGLQVTGKCVRATGGQADLSVAFPATSVEAGKTALATATTPWANPQLWSPEHPNLYWLVVEVSQGGKVIDRTRARFGFREFWIEGDLFRLNGIPIRLRGDSSIMAHSTMGECHRLDFMRAYFLMCKDVFGVNAARVHAAIGPPAIFDAADEIGVLLIAQSGIYSNGRAAYTRGGQTFLDNERQEFREWVRRDRNHPSVAIWDVANEMVRGDVNTWKWTQTLHGFVLENDASRPIEESGCGTCLGHASIIHVHHHENYTELLEAWNRKRDKPLVMGEWWVGGNGGEHRLTTGEEHLSYDDFRAKELLLAKERMDEHRSYGAAGTMPLGWTIHAFQRLPEAGGHLTWKDDTAPGEKPSKVLEIIAGWREGKPIYKPKANMADTYRRGLGPLFVCIREKWKTCWAGEALAKTITVANDSEEARRLQVRWTLEPSGAPQQRSADLTLQPGEVRHLPLDLSAPDVKAVTPFKLRVELLSEGKVVNWDEQQMTVYPREVLPLPASSRTIQVYDPASSALPLLAKVGAKAEPLKEFAGLKPGGLLVLGRGAADDKVNAAASQIAEFARAGGRVLCLEQTKPFEWLPVAPGFVSANLETPTAYAGLGIPDESRRVDFSRCSMIQAPNHPVFQDLSGDRLAWWRYGDGCVADDVFLKPTVSKPPVLGAFVTLSGGTRAEYAAIMELRQDKGFYLLCQAHVTDNVGVDPAATLLFRNMVAYGLADAPAPVTVMVIGRELPAYLKKTVRVDLPAQLALPASLPTPGILLLGPDAQLSAADAPRLQNWLSEGGKAVWFLPKEIPASLGLKVEGMQGKGSAEYVAVSSYDWFFAGLNSADLSWLKSPVQAGISSSSSDSLALIKAVFTAKKGTGRGFAVTQLRDLGAAAVSLPVGKGELIATTLNLLGERDPKTASVWGTFLTNLRVPLSGKAADAWVVASIEDINLDGNLQDWLSDVEDKLVSRWIHATPHPMVDANPKNSSLLVYLGEDKENLYLAAQLIDDHPIPKDRLFLDFGGTRYECRWDAKNQTRILDAGSKPVDAAKGASLPAGKGKKNQDIARLRGITGADAREGRTVEIALPWTLLPGGRDAFTNGTMSLAVEYQDVDAEAQQTLRRPAIGVLPLAAE